MECQTRRLTPQLHFKRAIVTDQVLEFIHETGFGALVFAQISVPKERGAFADELVKARVLLTTARRAWPAGEDHVVAVRKGDEKLVGVLGMIKRQATILRSRVVDG